jgi:mono/diheme cytochrome c family protein
MKYASALAGGLAAAAVFAATHDPGPRQSAAKAEPAGRTVVSDRPLSAGRAVFARVGCGSCHRFAAAGSVGPVGPDLDARLAFHDRASLLAAVRSPPASWAMPTDFAERMSAAELSALVDFLLSSRR